MPNLKIISILLLLLSAFSCGKKPNVDKANLKTETTPITIQDYLNAGKEITFDNYRYNLAWSSHPSENFYSQEYLQINDSLEKFKKLIILGVITGKQVKDAASDKVNELKKMKESDPFVNYDMFEKNGEIMLDFILSKNIPGTNEQEFVERNVYRYRSFNDNGKEGVLLFGVSERSYGNEIGDFLLKLKADRFALPNAVSSFVIPQIKIAGH